MADEESKIKAINGIGSAETEFTVTADDVRPMFGEIMERAWDGDRFIVTRHGRQRLAVIGMRDYENYRALQEAANQPAATAPSKAKASGGR